MAEELKSKLEEIRFRRDQTVKILQRQLLVEQLPRRIIGKVTPDNHVGVGQEVMLIIFKPEGVKVH